MLQEYRAESRAMGTDIQVLAVDSAGSAAVPRLLERALALFQREEARFSRFRPDSELSRLNQAGELREPSAAMWDVLRRARRWWRATGGDFDPTLLTALERAGYDRTFEAVVGRKAPAGRSAVRRPTGHSRMTLEESGGRRRVRLLDGARLDLGGIVKGWAVDRAAELLAPVGRFLVDAGGDIRAGGDSLDAPGWCVSLEDPLDTSGDAGYICVRDMAVATSGTYRRRWRLADGGEAHHLIDPASGMPSESGVVSATVVGASAEACDVWAKVALLRGVGRGLAFLEGVGAAGLLTDALGARHATSRWRWYPGPALEDNAGALLEVVWE